MHFHAFFMAIGLVSIVSTAHFSTSPTTTVELITRVSSEQCVQPTVYVTTTITTNCPAPTLTADITELDMPTHTSSIPVSSEGTQAVIDTIVHTAPSLSLSASGTPHKSSLTPIPSPTTDIDIDETSGVQKPSSTLSPARGWTTTTVIIETTIPAESTGTSTSAMDGTVTITSIKTVIMGTHNMSRLPVATEEGTNAGELSVTHTLRHLTETLLPGVPQKPTNAEEPSKTSPVRRSTGVPSSSARSGRKSFRRPASHTVSGATDAGEHSKTSSPSKTTPESTAISTGSPTPFPSMVKLRMGPDMPQTHTPPTIITRETMAAPSTAHKDSQTSPQLSSATDKPTSVGEQLTTSGPKLPPSPGMYTSFKASRLLFTPNLGNSYNGAPHQQAMRKCEFYCALNYKASAPCVFDCMTRWWQGQMHSGWESGW